MYSLRAALPWPAAPGESLLLYPKAVSVCPLFTLSYCIDDLCLPLLQVPNSGNPKSPPLSVLPSYWLLASLFRSNWVQVPRGYVQIHSCKQFWGTSLAFVIQAATDLCMLLHSQSMDTLSLHSLGLTCPLAPSGLCWHQDSHAHHPISSAGTCTHSNVKLTPLAEDAT